MPRAALNGVELYYEETGEGPPLVFCHEFAGDYRAWDPQVRAFARLYRCITYCHRGFPPSSVPTDPAAYSQDQLIADLLGLLDNLHIDRCHLIGFSMGGNGRCADCRAGRASPRSTGPANRPRGRSGRWTAETRDGNT